MIKYILGAGFILAMTTSAFAGPAVQPLRNRTVTYTFASIDGSAFCNGIKLTQNKDSDAAVGLALYSNCGLYNTNAGGIGARIRSPLGNCWIVMTTDPSAPGNSYMYILDESALFWELWGMNNTGSSSTFHAINQGSLLIGYDARGRGALSAAQIPR